MSGPWTEDPSIRPAQTPTEPGDDRYVLMAQSYRRATASTPWHILRVGETTPAPMILGLCDTETTRVGMARAVRVGSSPGRLCDRCRRTYGRVEAYVAQGPRPA